MIAADTNSWIYFLEQRPDSLVELMRQRISDESIIMPPMVLSELLSGPALSTLHRSRLTSVPQYPLQAGFWERSGLLRAKLLGRGLKPQMLDTFIAQYCVDHSLPLLTRDKDFAIFAKHAGLTLL